MDVLREGEKGVVVEEKSLDLSLDVRRQPDEVPSDGREVQKPRDDEEDVERLY